MLKRIFAEPLFHFALVALAIFGLYRWLNPPASERRDVIVVSAPKIEQLAGYFARTWQRPPTTEEMKGLIDDYVKEEIYYREALARGLDKDDETIRRRLRLKMEYLQDAGAETMLPTDSQLAATTRPTLRNSNSIPPLPCSRYSSARKSAATGSTRTPPRFSRN